MQDTNNSWRQLAKNIGMCQLEPNDQTSLLWWDLLLRSSAQQSTDVWIQLSRTTNTWRW